MSAELIENSRSPLSPTPRELAATLFRRPRLVTASFGFVLLATMLFVVFSARYESHFKVLLRRGRFDPIVSSQPAGTTDFARTDISEEELNSKVEPHPGSLQGHRSGTSRPHTLSAFHALRAKAHKSPAASGGDSVFQPANRGIRKEIASVLSRTRALYSRPGRGFGVA